MKDYIKAILQFCLLFIPFVVMRVIGLFVGIIAVNNTEKTTNKFGEATSVHRQKYIDKGSSGSWDYIKPKWGWLWAWGNDEDGYLGEPSGKWSANVEGNERTKWNMYLWSAVRNPANNFSRYTSWYGCPVMECDVEYEGTYYLNDNDANATGTQFVVATHKITGRKYYAFRIVWKYPYLDRVFHVRLGYKLKPSHATDIQDEDDKIKGWAIRIAIAPRVN